MFTVNEQNFCLDIDFKKAEIAALSYRNYELLSERMPIFKIGLMDKAGNHTVITAAEGECLAENANTAVYGNFPENIEVAVKVEYNDGVEWNLSVKNGTDKLVEWVEYPNVSVKPLAANGGDGRILYPYNEGAIVDDMNLRQKTFAHHTEPSYPSHGSFSIFPNMICSQFLCYLFDGKVFYLGAHDEKRGVKQIDFYKTDSGVALQFRIYNGLNFGENYASEFPIVWKMTDGDWQDGAEIYKNWFENHLPQGAKKIRDNEKIPEWYADSPLVLSYPVRGVHDMDTMTPNALFPYENALPVIDEIAEKTKARLLVLLMHWEGTAPWAPPYVWPPFGGEEMLLNFLEKLHDRKHLLGVYCSGFGFTKQSNLIAEYNCEKKFEENGYEAAMCAAPYGKVELSNICTGQRSGYDICVASEKAKEILDEAYRPLFESNLDYVQILDQNHGGGQYFCYSRDHGHPPAPGNWMTESMQKLLKSWNDAAGKTLFGCESASSEAFIPHLLFSDNRFELNWHFGAPVPLYSYLYHEYLRNFMGNQVSCGLSYKEENLCYRMAYSFTAGDCLTLVITPDGNIFPNWGCHDFSFIPNREKTLTFIANMTKLYAEDAKKYLFDGKMIKPVEYDCEKTFVTRLNGTKIEVPRVLSTAWEKDGDKAQIFVNHTDSDARVTFNGEEFTVPALGGRLKTMRNS